ncbi:sigma-70 region 4 domain-containing protein [Sphingopyxis yananensis]|uniref:sigma-70 region 4 domain-containing protein n=1 Tax=Sphingopyxis yananensis TaxID=2886687 RepID=UPI001D0FC53B|nr:sigma-70 region 4 domain-containing protein [Sphingopyxis yananensis]MCC2602399.1 sigma-70 region 4 domain-containing protein [Sphingopyxis yananensis]
MRHKVLKYRNERRKLRRYERAATRMSNVDRQIFLGHIVEDLSYRELAAQFGITTEEVERSLCRSLAIVAVTLEEKDPWWLRF